jgi:hypothetical protein
MLPLPIIEAGSAIEEHEMHVKITAAINAVQPIEAIIWK